MPADNLPALIREHAKLIARLARTVAYQANRLRQRVTVDELEAAGAVGLWQAASRWDGRPGVRFTTFAGPRILGAMLDWAREASPFPRGWMNPPFLRSLKAVRSREGMAALCTADFREMLSGLRADERLLLTLKYEAGLEVSEAAKAIGVGTRTGYQIHNRAIAKVRRVLAA